VEEAQEELVEADSVRNRQLNRSMCVVSGTCSPTPQRLCVDWQRGLMCHPIQNKRKHSSV